MQVRKEVFEYISKTWGTHLVDNVISALYKRYTETGDINWFDIASDFMKERIREAEKEWKNSI